MFRLLRDDSAATTVLEALATGQRIPVRGEKEMELKLGNMTYLHNVMVADIMNDYILGLDFMRKYCCEIDVKQGVLKCGQEELFMEGEDLPIRQRPRRLLVAREKEVEIMVKGMVKDGVIDPSSSPRCSPVVLVKKKDGSMRFCVDYRRLDDVKKKDSYPLTRIDDTLDMLTGVKWFSTLDLKSSYWQVEIDPKEKEKTAFSTGKGLW
ncbi:unnamed protein product [Parnassius apollo]|uniref:(apollo) hypothetical protein n=1 Tax=Parnassius apollo TaxID=110799 RepID=A0A8S3XS71_PARAO|nr:unnamed protein product [Parnassius apollo]